MVRPISISVKICLNISKFNVTVTNPTTVISKYPDSAKKNFYRIYLSISGLIIVSVLFHKVPVEY